MLIRLVPPPPHPTILYPLTFPTVFPLQTLGPGATLPAAWSSQLQLITSILQLEPPSSIHMLDRAVGLVARTREVFMDVPQKEILLEFIDGRVVSIPMSSDCVRILLGVALDVKGCSEHESQRDSMEGGTSPASMAGSTEDLPPGSSPTKSPKPGKHKRQRSLLFSLISSLVPKSLSLSSPSPPPTGPPPTPLPPLPSAGRVTCPIPQRTSFSLVPTDPDLLRQRARAALVDVWRRHVIPALPTQQLPSAGYAEWTLLGLASRTRAEIESFKAGKYRSHGFGTKRLDGSRHRRAQSEGRHALDFGDRNDDHDAERCRAPSPFPGVLDAEDADRVVYPRREQADEWGVRYIDHSHSFDESDLFAIDFSGHNDSLLGEQFAIGDDWEDNERLAFELSHIGRSGTAVASNFIDRHLHPDFSLDRSEDDGSGFADTAFDMSRTPLVPSDINDDEESDDSQVSLRTPEEGEELPLAPPGPMVQGSTPPIIHSPKPSSVSRIVSSRPRPRNGSSQITGVPGPHSSVFLQSHSMNVYDSDIDERIHSSCEYLERICTALEIVRNRAREEGWRLIRATMIGTSINDWMDSDMEKTLEIKAKRRAWSSGIKIYAPYPSTGCSVSKVWDGTFSTFRSPISPPGLTPPRRGLPRVRGPIVPTGLALGIPLRSSPLVMHTWSVDGAQPSTPSKYGILGSGRVMESIEGKKSPARVTFADNVTKLFPVCEDDNEDSIEPVQVNGVGFPQTVPIAISTDELEIMEQTADPEDDPFGVCPSRPRRRTTSMYMVSPVPSPSAPPMFRPNTPPPSYQAAIGGDIFAAANDGEGKLDASPLLLQPLSTLAITPSPLPPSRPPLTSNPPYVPRPRAVSLPVMRPSCSGAIKIRRTSFHHKEERCEDLSRTYASPPPEGPLVVTAAPAPHEQYPRYAHVYSPIFASKTGMNGAISTRAGKEVVFEQGGSEFSVGLEVAIGRAEEGRLVW